MVQLVHRRARPPNVEDPQAAVYTACVEQLRNLTHPPKWVYFVDGDEFLVLRKHATVTDFLVEELDQKGGGSLQISWLVFGTANRTKYDPAPVLKRFQWRLPEPHLNTKSIVVLDHLESVTNPHYVNLKKGYRRKAMDGRWKEPSINGAKCCLPPERRNTSVAAIHHYRIKSLEEFHYRRCVRGRIYKQAKLKSFCHLETPPGDVYDDIAWEIMKRNNPKYHTFDEK